MKHGDYESAALYYDQLITDHPKSPYLQQAQLAAIDARMKGYLGPEYDGSGLEKARELVKQTMATFPDRPAGNEKLYHTLDLINDQEAERTLRHRRVLPADRQGRLGRVLLRQDPPAMAQEPVGRQGQDAAGRRSPRCPASSRCPARS